MPYAAALIDRAMRAQGITTQAAFARLIDVKQPTVSQWRSGTHPMPDARVLELCALAGITDTGPWLIAAQADAARSEAVRTALESVLDRLRPALAGVGLLALGLAGFSMPSPSAATNLNDGHSVHYAKWRRRVRATLMRMATWWRYGPPPVLA